VTKSIYVRLDSLGAEPHVALLRNGYSVLILSALLSASTITQCPLPVAVYLPLFSTTNNNTKHLQSLARTYKMLGYLADNVSS